MDDFIFSLLVIGLFSCLGFLSGFSAGNTFEHEEHLKQTTQQICEQDLPRNEKCVQVWVKPSLD